MVMGTKGTMIVAGEKELMLYKELDRNIKGDGWGKSTTISVETKGGKPAMATSPSMAGAQGVSVPGTVDNEIPSRGYREELEHFRVLRAERQQVGLLRACGHVGREAAAATVPRRGGAGGRGDRPDVEPGDARGASDRLRLGLV